MTTEKRRNKFASDPKYHTAKHLSEKLMIIDRNKVNVKINKPVYLGVSILDKSMIMNYKYWYDYVKAKCGKKAKLWYIDMGSITVHVKLGDIYADLVGDVKKRFDASNYEVKTPVGKNKKGLD